MKIFWLTLSTLSLLATPVIAAEYQGKNIDGKKIPARVFYQQTGGVYDVEVEFNGDRATLHFTDGSQVILNLASPNINDPTNIIGYGRIGFIPINRRFSFGLESGDPNNNVGSPTPSPSAPDIWKIQLDPKNL